MPSSPIKHIVVLMMENRSFDHLIGLMKAENPAIRGISPGEYSNLTTAGAVVPVSNGATYQGQLTTDPGHEFVDVHMQMYGKPAAEHQPGDVPDMSGFVENYEQLSGAGRGAAVMKCFEPAQLPALTTLARSYAVLDAWFSSVPGPTLPNRAFAHFGTSFGRLDMSPDYFRAGQSIYQRLRQSGKSGKIYYYDPTSSTLGLTFLLSDQSSYFGLIGDFKRDCKKNRLPDYAFVEPNYSDHGGMNASDQHPDHSVIAGDNFIREIYEAIRSNDDVWQSTLLLIVWDEHGGLYDHEIPPAVGHPDGFTSVTPRFDFDRLGVRVPAVAVSPYIEPNTVDHTTYEHASIPATVTEQFIGAPAVHSPFNREKWAATFLHLLTRTMPRTDDPLMAMTRRAKRAPAMRDAVPRSTAAHPVSGLLAQQVADLHLELQRHHPGEVAAFDPGQVKTEADAAAFIGRAMEVIHSSAAVPAAPSKTLERRRRAPVKRAPRSRKAVRSRRAARRRAKRRRS